MFIAEEKKCDLCGEYDFLEYGVCPRCRRILGDEFRDYIKKVAGECRLSEDTVRDIIIDESEKW